MARITGLARSTVSQQVDRLVDHGIVHEGRATHSVRGRPPYALSISLQAGTIAAVDVDTNSTRVALADLSGHILAQELLTLPVAHTPENVIAAVSAAVRAMLKEHGQDPTRLRQVVVGLPAPVDVDQGCAIRPPIMPGWHAFPVGDELGAQLGAPVVVDNDVNIAAFGEATQEHIATPLLFIKVGNSIGGGIITSDGDIFRGADGAAGDIGHIRTSTRRGIVCKCGKTDCLEAVASYSAVLHDLLGSTPDSESATRDLTRLVMDSDTRALHRVRQAATDIGEVVAMLTHTLNPRTLVFGGLLSQLQDEILSGVRAAVYEQALPLATRKLLITPSQLGNLAGIVGAIALGRREVFTAAGIARLLDSSRAG